MDMELCYFGTGMERDNRRSQQKKAMFDYWAVGGSGVEKIEKKLKAKSCIID